MFSWIARPLSAGEGPPCVRIDVQGDVLEISTFPENPGKPGTLSIFLVLPQSGHLTDSSPAGGLAPLKNKRPRLIPGI
jgi:hypothetical protein